MTNKSLDTKKAPGPIRWNALIPFSIFCLFVYVYSHFFLDHTLRKFLEWGSYKALGVEVNIGSFETSFWGAKLSIRNIQITDGEKPSQNSVEIGDIRFGMSWDALLRAKILVNEAAIENIQFATTRKSPGKVAPPEPPRQGPSAVEEQAERLKQAALAKAEQEYADNMLGDLAAILGGTDSKAQLGKIESSLESKKKAQEIEAEIQQKQKYWDEKIRTLPNQKDLQALNDQFNRIKYKDFKSPQELQTSLQELDAVLKKGDAYSKQIGNAGPELENDLKKISTDIKSLDALIKADVKALESRFRIPSINPKDISRALFNKYLGKYNSKINHYRGIAEKYVPPKYLKKGKDKEDPNEVLIQPREREKGISYEFGRKNSYPLLWIKKATISSQAGMSPKSGNIRGEILDITTQQSLIGRPTVATLKGDFPADQIENLLLKIVINNLQPESLISYNMEIGSYPIGASELVQSPDVQISLTKATGKLSIEGTLKALRDFKMNINNQFAAVGFSVEAKDKTIKDILGGAFAGLPIINISGVASGYLPAISFDISSNIGTELERGLRRQVDAKIAEARRQIETYINGEVGKTREAIEKQVSQLKNQLATEIKKIEGQLDTQKKQAETKANQAKKDAENQGRKQIEKEGQKAVDDLKKKFGF